MEEIIRDAINIPNDEDITLIELIELPILQQMQDAFAKMARMAAIITDSDGVPITTGTNFSEMCSEYCRKSPIGKLRCENCDRMSVRMTLEQKKPVSYKCHANLVEFGAPIMLGERIIGGFVGGQVLAEALDEAETRRVAREIKVDEDRFVEASAKIQIIPQAAIDRSTKFVYDFAKMISDMAYNSYKSKLLTEEAMQAAIQKQDFLANMSHEIRTPMNAVLGMAEMALRESMSNEAKGYIEQIQLSGKHLLTIINDILDFSKIDSGRMPIVETVYETEALITDLSSVINSRIGDKNIIFIIDVPCDMPIELYGDYVRIHQVIINLLNNAVKFTQSGFIKLKMSFDEIDNENVLFKASVTDTGNGITKEDLAKLFVSFQQVDSKRNRSVEGTGLGLAISKQIVELMGGSISVESEYGKGSTFSVEFPQRVQTKGEHPKEQKEPIDVYLILRNKYSIEQIIKDLSNINCNIVNLNDNDILDFKAGSYIIMERGNDAADIIDMSERFSDSTVIVSEPYDSENNLTIDNVKFLKRPLYSKKLLAALGLMDAYSRENVSDDDIFSFVAPDAKVLIVDDNTINLTVAAGLLEPVKMQIDTATGAMQCIELIQNKKYDLIFMDHMMPGVDGIETTRIIRRMYTNYSDVPIIALTANATADAQAMFLSEGMNDFVAKPIETKKIVAMVRKWLPDHMIVPVDASERKLEDVTEEESIINKIDFKGLNVKEALALLRNEKLYLNFLKEYYLSIDTKAERIMRAFIEKDIKTYTIEVHALKSSSRQIGADDLARDAERLENAGNENDLETIEACTHKLMWDYKLLKGQLEPIFEEKENSEKQTLNLEIVDSYIEKISQAIDDFDFVQIEEIFEDIATYELKSDEEKAIIEKIKEFSSEFEQEEVNKYAEEWKHMYS